MNETLDEFLGEQRADDLILHFDSDFDVPFRHGLCIGLLEMLDSFASQAFGDDDDRRAIFVGAWWCRIIRSDVTYQVLPGLEAVADTRNEAEVLAHHVLADGQDGPRIRAYAAARWHDGAGKIHFRCGDFAEARLLFERAVEIAHHADLGFCLPDLQSNLIRARFDEQSLAGAPPAERLRAEYEALVSATRAAAVSVGIAERDLISLEHEAVAAAEADDISGAGALPSRYREVWSTEERELARGLSSATHNLAIACRADRDWSASLSRQSAAISWGLGDHYRLAQSLNHQAGLAAAGGDLRWAEHLYRHVIALPGVRAQRIARQQLVAIAARDGRTDTALDSVKKLLTSLQADRSRRGGNMGFDAVFESYTVGIYREIVTGAFAEDVSEQQALEGIEAEMIRSVRRVVKTSTYKTAYSKLVHPYFLRQIHQRIQDDHWMESVSLAEEATSRELQDMIATTGRTTLRQVGQMPLRSRTAGASNSPHRVKPSSAHRGAVSRQAPGNDDTSRALRQQRSQFEQAALAEPLAVVSHDPEIANEARRFTANHRDTTIVRYVLYGEAQGHPTDLGAYVFHDGRRPSFIPLALDRLTEFEFDPEIPPTLQLARHLWDSLFEPLWSETFDTVDQTGSDPRRLVLIPAGPLFRLPLHIALHKSWTRPLAAHTSTSFSVSLTAYIKRSRYLLAQQPFDATDDLCVLAPHDEAIYPGEIDDLGWDPAHLHVAGQVPQHIGSFQYRGMADRDGLEALIAQEPEIFIYAGHGRVIADEQGTDPGLVLDDGWLSHYSLASRVRLPRNKWTLLGACVTGQGAGLEGGEVSGLLRAFMGAGAGVVGVTLWSVENDAIANAIRALLLAARTRGESKVVDAVAVLRDHYASVVPDTAGSQPRAWPVRVQPDAELVLDRRLRACPLMLYL
jgi:hypothetical protein